MNENISDWALCSTTDCYYELLLYERNEMKNSDPRCRLVVNES